MSEEIYLGLIDTKTRRALYEADDAWHQDYFNKGADLRYVKALLGLKDEVIVQRMLEVYEEETGKRAGIEEVIAFIKMGGSNDELEHLRSLSVSFLLSFSDWVVELYEEENE